MAERFGRYWLHECIGRGGMADVFRATIGPDPDTYSFQLAIKRLRIEDEQDRSQLDMFLTEADVAKFLQHPNLVRVYETGLVEERAYIAMEYLQGYDLAELISIAQQRQVAFPPELAVYITLQVLRALDYLHRATSAGGVPMDLVHRDVTPSNIFLNAYGEVKVGDFGVARISFLENQEDAGVLKGKAAYMPPEVLEGELVDQKVDLWSLSASLYEMLTLQSVFAGISDQDLMSGIAPPDITKVRKANPEVDSKLARIVDQALHRKPKRRPSDALTLYRQLKLYLRDAEVSVDVANVASFLSQLTGIKPGARRLHERPAEGDFAKPDYQVPIGPSPTQRFHLVQPVSRGPSALAIIVIAVVGALFAGAGGMYLLLRGSPPATETGSEGEPPAQPPSKAAAEEQAAAERTKNAADVENGSGQQEAPADSVEPLADIKDPTARFRALLQQGRAAKLQAEHEKAVRLLDAAVGLRPEHEAARLIFAESLIELERFDDAEMQVNKLLEMKPRNGRAYLLLGHIFAGKGDRSQARWAYKRSISLEPRSRTARAAKRALSGL